MPIDPNTLKMAADFGRRVAFAAARAAAVEVEHTAVEVAVPLLQRAQTIGTALMETVKAAQAAAERRRDGR